MEFKEVVGDLFSSPETCALAHCVSEDLKMGKGIAVIFKKKFEGLDELTAQNKPVGEVAVLQCKERYVYYLITKKYANQKPTYSQLRSSLEAMKKHCLESGVTNLAMPRIGCGLDGLDWSEVSKLIKEVFADCRINITIYSLK